jgi:hypothetical protein
LGHQIEFDNLKNNFLSDEVQSYSHQAAQGVELSGD